VYFSVFDLISSKVRYILHASKDASITGPVLSENVILDLSSPTLEIYGKSFTDSHCLRSGWCGCAQSGIRDSDNCFTTDINQTVPSKTETKTKRNKLPRDCLEERLVSRLSITVFYIL